MFQWERGGRTTSLFKLKNHVCFWRKNKLEANRDKKLQQRRKKKALLTLDLLCKWFLQCNWQRSRGWKIKKGDPGWGVKESRVR